MIDDDERRVDPRDHAGPDHYGETMLYDFAKFLTTLSLLVLGGMLTLSTAARSGDLKLFNLIFVTCAVAFAGILAFVTANGLVDARSTGREPSPMLPRIMKASTGLIGLGVGGFLMMWMDTLS
jgi:hypothetical protein